jgi:hypothetical protein
MKFRNLKTEQQYVHSSWVWLRAVVSTLAFRKVRFESWPDTLGGLLAELQR